MGRITLLTALFGLILSTTYTILPQSNDQNDLRKLVAISSEVETDVAITEYVYKMYIQDGERRIPEEKFLISLMGLVNREISRRLEDPKAAREDYFKSLHNMLVELQTFQNRLRLTGIRELDEFSEDLSERIKYTIDAGDIDFSKKKVFEEAIQMLYVSEEMIKLDEMQSPSDLSRKIQSSQQRLMTVFGESQADDGVYLGRKPTIYDLFVEWRKTEEVKYSRRLAEVLYIRKSFLRISTLDDITHMFNDQLKVAYKAFNFEEYELAELLLTDLLETYLAYGVNQLDDVYFYRGECFYALDRLMHAEKDYETVLAQYPGTPFLPQVYSRLVQINFTMKNYESAKSNALQYQNLAANTDADYYDIQFLLAMSQYHLGEYNQSIETLLNTPADHSYYTMSQYFIGNAYSELGAYDDAVSVYLTLINSKSIPPNIHSRALYKMGLIEYERANYGIAIDYFNRISFEFSRYDKILNALAWSHFELERAKGEDEFKDFSTAGYYARQLMNNYYASPFRMEATGLLAYINQLVSKPRQAIDLYREVYQEKVKYSSIEDYLKERQNLENLYRSALTAQENSLRENNPEAYMKATKLAANLKSELTLLDLSESSSAGLDIYREANSVISQIKESNRLRLLAEETGNKRAIHRIDSLQIRLAAMLETFPPEVLDKASGVNFFDDHPVSKYVAEEQYRYQDMVSKQEEIAGEMTHIDDLVSRLDNQIDLAKSIYKNYDVVAKLEHKRGRLMELKKRYDFLMVSIQQFEYNGNPYPEFNRWGDLGAFGIINVYFDQKQQMQNKLVQVADVFEQVNVQLDNRRRVIEDKIKKIESEVRFMTMKARLEERKRLRAERERAFRESYFDTRESEIPDDIQQ